MRDGGRLPTSFASAAEEWEKVGETVAGLMRYGAFRSVVAPMSKLIERLEHDPSFADVRPVVSHAALVLARAAMQRRVMVAHHEGDTYVVYFVDHPFELSERRVVHEDEVLQVLRESLEKLGEIG